MRKKYTVAGLKNRCVIDPITECWLWSRCTHNGYAWVRHDGRTHYAHRLAYTLKHGDVDASLDVGATCNGPRHCINPAHHKPGTRTEIMRSVIERGRIAKGARKGMRYRGERTHFAKLDWPKVREIRSRLADGANKSELADANGISISNVHRIARYDTWKEGFAA